MGSSILDKSLQRYRAELSSLLQKMQQLAADINNGELQQTTESLHQNIDEPFLFVVVGEVKAGKSSFVNALLEAEVCATDIEPCTDAIQQIVYADQPFAQQIEPSLRKLGRPIDILKDISVVDTPGTNTIIEEHQVITERYIPNSDLTFFVLFAKNPYQKSAWNFLDFVNVAWRKKVIFILQQADLLRPEELERTIARVREYANQKQITAPTIFATSAVRELENEPGSGFEAVRTYIREMVASGESYKLKLRSVSETTQKIITFLSTDIQAVQEQLETDRKAMTSIRNRIAAGQTRSRYEIDSLVDRLAGRYEVIAARIKAEFRESLSVLTVVRRAFVGIFNKEQSIQAWIEDFQQRCQENLKSSLEDVSQDGAKHFVDGIRQLLKDLTQDLDTAQTRHISTDTISLSVLERRQEVLDSVRGNVERLLDDEGLVHSMNADADDMTTEIVGGAFIAISGAILHAIEFAVAEVILNAIGIAFAGIGVVLFAVGAVWQRNRIVGKFERALDGEKEKFKQDVTDRLDQKLSIIYEEVERIFVQFYDYVEREEQTIAPIISQYEKIQTDAKTLFNQSPK